MHLQLVLHEQFYCLSFYLHIELLGQLVKKRIDLPYRKRQDVSYLLRMSSKVRKVIAGDLAIINAPAVLITHDSRNFSG